VSFAKQTLQALGKIGIVLAIGIAFLSGLAGTVYLSLRSAEVKVPEIIGKDRLAAEAALNDAGLHLRLRGTRYSADAQPNTILDQLPKAGEVIKVGQTVAIVLSRAAAKEGESSMPPNTGEKQPEAEKPKENENANKTTTANNQNENQNQNQNKEKRTRNKNTNNSNNSNNGNANNRNAINANNRNVNASPNTNAENRNVNTNSNRSPDNSNTNKRAPVNISTPPFNPSGNTP
jgi:beta-lactam-binding protein with PASTA domain